MILAVIMLSSMVGCSASNVQNEDEKATVSSLLDQIIDRGTVKIAVFSDVTPLGYTDSNNELTGIEIDIAKDLAAWS